MASNVNIVKIIISLSDRRYDNFMELIEPRLEYYYPKHNPSKHVVIEKVCDYIELHKVKNACTFNQLLFVYADELLSILGNKIEKNSRSYNYYNKVKDNYATKKKTKKNLSLEDIADISRVFLCIYTEYIGSKHMVSEFSFELKDIKLRTCIKEIEKEQSGKGKLFQDKNSTIEKYGKISFVELLLTIMYFYMRNMTE